MFCLSSWSSTRTWRETLLVSRQVRVLAALWAEVSAALNALGPAVKAVRHWRKYWSRLCCDSRKLARDVERERRRTGGGRLGGVEGRVLAILDRTGPDSDPIRLFTGDDEQRRKAMSQAHPVKRRKVYLDRDQPFQVPASSFYKRIKDHAAATSRGASGASTSRCDGDDDSIDATAPSIVHSDDDGDRVAISTFSTSDDGEENSEE
ncbi:hypothetical protein HPB52_021721 [Rhipicephalus sanguineus]|uniref:Uncharacterized protein n=1 Tax=Rhipicephalus sanguineus TaxID=34632 RepID=A0A9D4Q8C4_RHISA|nr:hypothetical protein HPB52_021721 [Rhipicephalus sanguineus]